MIKLIQFLLAVAFIMFLLYLGNRPRDLAADEKYQTLGREIRGGGR